MKDIKELMIKNYPYIKRDKKGDPIIKNGQSQFDEEWIKNNPESKIKEKYK